VETLPLDAVPDRRLDTRVRNRRGVLFIARAEHAFELSDAAAFVWRQIDGRRTVRQLAERMAAEYDLDLSTAEQDVGELCAALAGQGIITVSRDH
jgi:hypothetical protein